MESIESKGKEKVDRGYEERGKVQDGRRFEKEKYEECQKRFFHESVKKCGCTPQSLFPALNDQTQAVIFLKTSLQTNQFYLFSGIRVLKSWPGLPPSLSPEFVSFLPCCL